MRKRVAKTGISIAEKLMLRVDEVADLLGLGRDEVYSKARAGIIGSAKVGKRVLIPRAEVDLYAARLVEAARQRREQGVEVEG